jgi:hypothetical protein
VESSVDAVRSTVLDVPCCNHKAELPVRRLTWS